MSLLGSRLILIFDLSFSMMELIGSMEATYSINTFFIWREAKERNTELKNEGKIDLHRVAAQQIFSPSASMKGCLDSKQKD